MSSSRYGGPCAVWIRRSRRHRSEEHTSELQSHRDLHSFPTRRSSDLCLPGAALALTLFSYPYVFLTVRGALRGMDPAIEEASRNLGIGGWATFFRVTLLQLRPAMVAGVLLVALYSLSDFGAVSLLQFD